MRSVVENLFEHLNLIICAAYNVSFLQIFDFVSFKMLLVIKPFNVADKGLFEACSNVTGWT